MEMGSTTFESTSPPRDRLLEELLASAEAAGLQSEDLDDVVHELASSIAADINNSGLEGQLGYLIDQLGGQAARKPLARLAEGRSAAADRK